MSCHAALDYQLIIITPAQRGSTGAYPAVYSVATVDSGDVVDCGDPNPSSACRPSGEYKYSAVAWVRIKFSIQIIVINAVW